jgi:hypothetical protein
MVFVIVGVALVLAVAAAASVMWLVWTMVAVVLAGCIVMGILFYNGRGLRFLAGYNTMSEEERKKVNARAIGKASGLFMIAMGFLIGALIFATVNSVDWLMHVLLAVVFALVAGFVVWTNKSGRFRAK